MYSTHPQKQHTACLTPPFTFSPATPSPKHACSPPPPPSPHICLCVCMCVWTHTYLWPSQLPKSYFTCCPQMSKSPHSSLTQASLMNTPTSHLSPCVYSLQVSPLHIPTQRHPHTLTSYVPSLSDIPLSHFHVLPTCTPVNTHAYVLMHDSKI